MSTNTSQAAPAAHRQRLLTSWLPLAHRATSAISHRETLDDQTAAYIHAVEDAVEQQMPEDFHTLWTELVAAHARLHCPTDRTPSRACRWCCAIADRMHALLGEVLA